MSLFLASQSPRRAQILEALGLSFKVLKFETEETHPQAENLEKGVLENAYRKAQLGLEKVKGQGPLIIAADTLVSIEDQVLGKPADKIEALTMLNTLSGKKHRVVTGLVLMNERGDCTQSAVDSWVFFRALVPQEIQMYVDTSEPYDKAGSYAVQGLGSLFIDKIEGSYSNIMGFPIEQFLKDLEKISGKSIYKWFSR